MCKFLCVTQSLLVIKHSYTQRRRPVHEQFIVRLLLDDNLR